MTIETCYSPSLHFPLSVLSGQAMKASNWADLHPVAQALKLVGCVEKDLQRKDKVLIFIARQTSRRLI